MTEQTNSAGENAAAEASAGTAAPKENQVSFNDLGLSDKVLHAVTDLGFELPSKIQERAIPVILGGHDLIGQAQTGTGKTAAFALPLLSKTDFTGKDVRILVILPTRELAIQVAEAFQQFSKYLEDFHVLPIYGGASYETQIRALKRGVQVVVGTPGRVIDLMKREKLDTSHLSAIVLDEGDEMLRMGFIDDIEWILSQIPEERQMMLFSATMPKPIRKVAERYLHSPVEIRIESKTQTASTVRQRYWLVSGMHKIDAMARLLEVEPYDAVLIFVRTKNDAEEVSQKLAARGFACDALHGDIPQKMREKIVDKLRNGQLDILVATDVAARGLDVDRITHVINYDIPYDSETYVHRIGRTGRAGREGDAILFISPRERRALRTIEQSTHQKIEPMKMPTTDDINKHRVEAFKQKILDGLGADDLEPYAEIIAEILEDDSIDPTDLCAVLAKMANGNEPLTIEKPAEEPEQTDFDEIDSARAGRMEKIEQEKIERDGRRLSTEAMPLRDFPDIKMVKYRVAVGRRDGVKPGQIVGAIANEGDIESKYIGHIDIFGSFSTVDLPEMPDEVHDILARAMVCGKPLDIRVYDQVEEDSGEPGRGDFPRGGRSRPRFFSERHGRGDYSDKGSRRGGKPDFRGEDRRERSGFRGDRKDRFPKSRDFGGRRGSRPFNRSGSR